MHIDIIKILVLIKIGSQRLINVIIVKILKITVSIIIKFSVLEDNEKMIIVKNIANTIFITL